MACGGHYWWKCTNHTGTPLSPALAARLAQKGDAKGNGKKGGKDQGGKGKHEKGKGKKGDKGKGKKGEKGKGKGAQAEVEDLS